MFDFLKSERSKLLSAAKNWIYLGEKVYNFRKDQLSEGDLSELGSRINEVQKQRRAKPLNESKLDYAVKGLEEHLKKVGGNFYPRSSLAENVDFFFYALVIYLGFTAFFVKPFKIPTNSMWPTYHGMTAEVWEEAEEAPGAVGRAFRFLAFGASRYEVKAPADGELMIPVYQGTAYRVPYEVVGKRRFLILPGKGYKYGFQVGDATAEVVVPQDFGMEEQVLREYLFDGEEEYVDGMREMAAAHGSEMATAQIRRPDGRVGMVPLRMIRTGRHFREGETVLAFDVLTGDNLLVDRMSYHFVRPETGDGFVFRTRNIPGIADDKFYIKRLVGTPGDTVEISDGGLLVNGEPAEGSIAFERNAEQVPPYSGYVGKGYLQRGEVLTVPEDRYFALGDNSDHSADGRDWGFVPEEDVIGKPFIIYYPFTRRWGLTR